MILCAPFFPTVEAQVPADCRQLVVAVGRDWNASKATLHCYERKNSRSPWQPALFVEGIPVLLGKNGMAWGIGEFQVEADVSSFKKEKDRRAPAGIFRIGRLFGYANQPPPGTTVPYHQVTKWDAWPDDPTHPLYNRLVTVDPNVGIPPWFEKARLRLGDFAYEWKLEIRHNSDPPVAGMGSAIFFHIRRGESVTTHGCTTMKESDLVKLFQWTNPAAGPRYVLLPQAEYEARRNAWKLP